MLADLQLSVVPKHVDGMWMSHLLKTKSLRREGFEPPTAWFEARNSIQLSYRRISLNGTLDMLAWLGRERQVGAPKTGFMRLSVEH